MRVVTGAPPIWMKPVKVLARDVPPDFGPPIGIPPTIS